MLARAATAAARPRPALARAMVEAAAPGTTIKGRSRFYKTVDVQRLPEGFHVRLDGHVLRSPARRPLVLPTEALATAVALEWDAQQPVIEPAAMPLMSLLSTAVDQVAEDRARFEREQLAYLHTDAICFYGEESDVHLLKVQRERWDPLHAWLEQRFGGALARSFGDIAALPHAPALVDAVTRLVRGLNSYELAALHCIAAECKSTACALAVYERQLTVSEAIAVARTEEEYQAELWGVVEGGHDLDRVNARVKVASASVLLWLASMD